MKEWSASHGGRAWWVLAWSVLGCGAEALPVEPDPFVEGRPFVCGFRGSGSGIFRVFDDADLEVEGRLRLRVVRLVQGFCRGGDAQRHYIYPLVRIAHADGRTVEHLLTVPVQIFDHRLTLVSAGAEDQPDGTTRQVALIHVQGLTPRSIMRYPYQPLPTEPCEPELLLGTPGQQEFWK